MDLYIFDGTPIIRKFMEDTADRMDCPDYDLDEIVAYYPEYLKNPACLAEFSYHRTGKDHQELTSCIELLYAAMNLTLIAVKPLIVIGEATVELRIPQRETNRLRSVDIIVRIYSHDNHNPRIVNPPNDYSGMAS